MKKRYLGKNKLEVSALGLGCMGMTGHYGELDNKESIYTIHKALDLGLNFFDTADSYDFGKNEELLGKALKGKREKAIIATKFGFMYKENGSIIGINGKPEYVKEAVHASLRRLGVDYIDLYYLHRVDSEIPIEETIGVMADMVKEGKIGYIGLSEVSADTLRRANNIHPITALQTEYSLWSLDIEQQILPTARELGISLVPYSPLGRGFLTGKVKSFEDLAEDDFRRKLPRFQEENFQKNIQLVIELEKIAFEKGIKASQLALAWVLAQGNDIVPIPGTKKRRHLEENLEAVDIELTDEDINRIDNIKVDIVGERYFELGMKFIQL